LAPIISVPVVLCVTEAETVVLAGLEELRKVLTEGGIVVLSAEEIR